MTGRYDVFQSVRDNLASWGYNANSIPGDAKFSLGYEHRFQNAPLGVSTELHYNWAGPIGVAPDAGGVSSRRPFQINTSWGTAYGDPHPMGWIDYGILAHRFTIDSGSLFNGAFSLDFSQTPKLFTWQGAQSLTNGLTMGGNITINGNGTNTLNGIAIIKNGNVNMTDGNNKLVTIDADNGEGAVKINRVTGGAEGLLMGSAAGGTIFGGQSNSEIIATIGNPNARNILFQKSIDAGATFTTIATLTTAGDFTANSLIKSGGTSSQILLADGSTMSTTGIGSVTSVSVTTANGVSGSVANPNSTPNITLTLGAITPTSVSSSGAITGTTLGGTLNTAAQPNITSVGALTSLTVTSSISAATITTTGLDNYATNINGSLTSLSKAPKGYIDSLHALAVVSANNGLTNNAGTVQLGGTLIQNTTVTHNSNSVQFAQTKGMDNTGAQGVNGQFNMNALTTQDVTQVNYSGTYGAITNPSSAATVLQYASIYSGVNGTSYAQNTGAFTGTSPYSGVSGWNLFSNTGNLAASAALQAKTPRKQSGMSQSGNIIIHAGFWVDSIRTATDLTTIKNAYGIYQPSSLDTNLLAGVNNMGVINATGAVTGTHFVAQSSVPTMAGFATGISGTVNSGSATSMNITLTATAATFTGYTASTVPTKIATVTIPISITNFNGLCTSTELVSGTALSSVFSVRQTSSTTFDLYSGGNGTVLTGSMKFVILIGPY